MIFNENFKPKITDSVKTKMVFHENCKFNFTGDVFIKIGDSIFSHDEVVKNPDYHLHNMIENSASILISEWANADENQSNHIPGITYLAVGTGDPGWDKFHPPLPTITQGDQIPPLIAEVGRIHKTLSATPYVDSFGNNTATPTPIVDFEFTFPGGSSPALIPPGSLDAVLVEMGLFGGAGANATGGGIMFNYLTFSAISKPVNAALTLVWRINFLPTAVNYYYVTYAGNGNTGGVVPIDANSYQQGTTVTVLGNTGSLVKTGSTFSGWNTLADGSGTSYAPGATFLMGSVNVILYAQWI